METITLIINISTILIVLYLAFLKSYFSEKGKNVATKEDIGKITNEIEQVKQRYTEENELLKTNLNLHLSIQQDKNRDIKNAILNFFDELINLIFNSFDIKMSNYDSSDYSYLKKRRIFIDECRNKVNINFERMKLFVKNNNLIELSDDLIKLTMKHNLVVQKFLIDTEFECSKREIIKKNAKPREDISTQLGKSREKEMKILDAFNKETINFHAELDKSIKTFIKVTMETFDNLNNMNVPE